MPKQVRFGPTQRCEIVDPIVCFARHHELVELRRLDAGARKHRVRLAPMMNLVCQQVHQYVARQVALDERVSIDR